MQNTIKTIGLTTIQIQFDYPNLLEDADTVEKLHKQLNKTLEKFCTEIYRIGRLNGINNIEISLPFNIKIDEMENRVSILIGTPAEQYDDV